MATGVGYAPTFARIQSLATTNATVVKTTPGSVSDIVVANANAAIRYLKLYDLARVPLPATDTPYITLTMAANGLQTVYAPPNPPKFVNGISYVIVTGKADTDATAVAADDITGGMNFY